MYREFGIKSKITSIEFVKKNEYLWRRSLVKTPGMIFTEKKRVNYWLLDESILQLRIPNSFGGKKTNRVFGCRSTLTANKTKGYVTMQKMSWLYKQDLWFCKCQILDFSIWIISWVQLSPVILHVYSMYSRTTDNNTVILLSH